VFAIPASASITVPHFIDQVFETMARPKVALRIDELGEERATTGSDFSVSRKIAWIDYVMRILVTDYQPPYRIAYRLYSKDTSRRSKESPPIDALYAFSAIPEGTLIRFTQRNNFRHPLVLPLAILLWPLAVFGARKEVRRLKERIEAELEQ
jgi:hypothetical protein